MWCVELDGLTMISANGLLGASPVGALLVCNVSGNFVNGAVIAALAMDDVAAHTYITQFYTCLI